MLSSILSETDYSLPPPILSPCPVLASNMKEACRLILSSACMTTTTLHSPICHQESQSSRVVLYVSGWMSWHTYIYKYMHVYIHMWVCMLCMCINNNDNEGGFYTNNAMDVLSGKKKWDEAHPTPKDKKKISPKRPQKTPIAWWWRWWWWYPQLWFGTQICRCHVWGQLDAFK